MTRIRLVNEDNGTEEQLAAMAALQSRRPGPVNNIHSAITNSPAAIGPFVALADALRADGELDPKLREIAILAVLRRLRSRYAFVRHWKIALSVGVREETLLALRDPHVPGTALSELDRSVIALAEEVTSHVKASDKSWYAVYDRLGDRQTMELLLNVGLYNFVARVTEPAQLDDEPGFMMPPLALEVFSLRDESLGPDDL
jgi:4-carboxymuconolactone decarboxylase